MGDWTENKYVETRFGGMDAVHEPHTLDRDSGAMREVFNMQTRTQALATRGGYVMAYDLTLGYSPAPGTKKSAIGLVPYDTNLELNDDEDEDEEIDDSGTTVTPVVLDTDDDDDKPHVGPGDRKRKEDEEDLPAVAGSFTASAPSTVYAYVPFTLSVTRSGGSSYSGGDAQISVKTKQDDSAAVCTSYTLNPGIGTSWSNNSWSGTMRVTSLNRNIDGLEVKIYRTDDDSKTASMTYKVGSMVPELPGTVAIGEEFTYTIQYKSGGSVLTGYNGGGVGMTKTLYGVDASGNRVSGFSFQWVGSVSWSSGVMTGKAKVTASGNAAKVRMAVTFAGETQTDDADFSAGVTVSACPQKLHVYGDAGNLQMSY